MDNWIQTRESSKDKVNQKRLSESNHIFNFKDRLLEIYGMQDEVKNNSRYKAGFGLEHSITAWEDDKMARDENGNTLDLIVHTKGDEIVWEPFIEYILRKDILKRSRIDNFDFGYIDGRKSHLGPFPSTALTPSSDYPFYSLWIEINRNGK